MGMFPTRPTETSHLDGRMGSCESGARTNPTPRTARACASRWWTKLTAQYEEMVTESRVQIRLPADNEEIGPQFPLTARARPSPL